MQNEKLKLLDKYFGITSRLLVILFVYSFVASIYAIYKMVADQGTVGGTLFLIGNASMMLFSGLLILINLGSKNIDLKDQVESVDKPGENEIQADRDPRREFSYYARLLFSSYIMAVGLSIVAMVALKVFGTEDVFQQFLKVHGIVEPTLSQLALTVVCIPIVHRFLREA